VLGDAASQKELSVTTRIRTSTHPWTTAQEEELRRLARANTAPAEIAARLSRTPEQVFEHAYELGLTLPRAQSRQQETGSRE
jgi:DNA-binding CsgD family transcriptional regulator